jgi:hypothetical protein
MSTTITPLGNAVDSLERAAGDLEAADVAEPRTLKGALGWGWHAVGLLAYLRLSPRRALFDAWLQDFLHEGEPELEIERDARWEERERLSFLELIDLLSQEDLPILKPEFYQGWQDRAVRCRTLRRQMAGIVGSAIQGEQRDPLLLLLAAYHRLIRLPAGVALDGQAILTAYPALLDLAELLLDQSAPEAGAARAQINRCRKALARG